MRVTNNISSVTTSTLVFLWIAIFVFVVSTPVDIANYLYDIMNWEPTSPHLEIIVSGLGIGAIILFIVTTNCLMNNIIQTKNDYNPDIERLVEENKFLKQKMLNDVHLRNEFKHLKKTMTDLVVKNNQTSKRPKRTMTDVEYEKILNTPIASIDFGENNTRIQNVLKFQDITTVAELVVLTKGQCMKFRHLGKHALFDIVAYLETKVLCLGMEVSWVEQYVKQENEKHKRLRL